MTTLRLPKSLAARRGERGGFGDWIAALPGIVAELAERWGLQVGEPYEPGGYGAWVAPARGARGEPFVLKVGWRHTEAAHEADALRVWRGDGAVLLHSAIEFDQTSALLLERCLPGTPLGQSVPEHEQDVVVAALLRRLWRSPEEGQPFRPLHVMCDEWAAEFEATSALSPGRLDAGLAREGIAMFRALPRSADASVLLCTDLHAANVLAAAREPWLVIDPKPYVGDPHYDALQHMLNCTERLRSDPAGFAGRMADLLELDAGRLALWLFARCVQESIGNPLLCEVATRLAP